VPGNFEKDLRFLIHSGFNLFMEAPTRSAQISVCAESM
jgi:hypothetical protein